MTREQPRSYSLMVHGGAGALDHIKSDREAIRYLESIRIIVEYGREVLERGASAMEAVETCAALLEDDPLYNAGCGSVLNEEGKVELDAAIMDGQDLSAGAVACVQNIANPTLLASLVRAHSEHVMLIGPGAVRFAEHHGVELVPDHYFMTPERIEQHKMAHQHGWLMLDHESDVARDEQKYGTVGAIARDVYGNLAAATSTGGIVNKYEGRVGDSPIVGAGVYADNETCAVSATGYGEDFMRTVLAKTIADIVDLKGVDAQEATKMGIEYLVRKVQGRGGVIVIDREGNCASQFTTPRMIRGWIEKSGETQCTFERDPD